jgi:hypothetical protein
MTTEEQRGYQWRSLADVSLYCFAQLRRLQEAPLAAMDGRFCRRLAVKTQAEARVIAIFSEWLAEEMGDTRMRVSAVTDNDDEEPQEIMWPSALEKCDRLELSDETCQRMIAVVDSLRNGWRAEAHVMSGNLVLSIFTRSIVRPREDVFLQLLVYLVFRRNGEDGVPGSIVDGGDGRLILRCEPCHLARAEEFFHFGLPLCV